MKEIAVIGAGAVGCFLAARLSAAGYQVTLVARGAQLAALQRDGLSVRERGEARRYALTAVAQLRTRPDLLLLAVKTQDLAEATAAVAPLARGVPVVTLQNGVQADHIVAAALGKETLLGAVVVCAVSYLQPGEIEVQFPGWLVLGAPFSRRSPLLSPMVEVLGSAVPTSSTPHLRRVRWSKLVSNLNNGLCAATNLTLPQIAASPLGRFLSLKLMREGCDVASSAGIHLDHGFYGLSPRALRREPRLAVLALLQAAMTSALISLPEAAALRLLAAAGHSRLNQLPVRLSTWQSLARGRLTEIDYLNGEIARLGARIGRPTPYNARVVSLVHRIEEGHPFFQLEDLVPPELHPVRASTAQPVTQ